MRPSHLLASNKGLEFPEDFVFFDTETTPHKISEDEIEHRFRLGVALYWRNYKGRKKDTLKWLEFSNPQQFWDFVESKALSKRRLIVMAHNLQYDMKVIKGFDNLKRRKYLLIKLISEQFVNIWKFRKKDKTLLFLDSMNFFKLPLKILGRDIGFEKATMPEFDEDNETWSKYCKQDVEILYQAIKQWLQFVKENELGCFSVTLASQAFNAFRHRFNPADIYIHNNKKAIALERESYHGGRVECFFLGKLPKEEYFYLDVNSMYPFVMKSNLYPIKLKSYLKTLTISTLKKLLSQYCVVAKVKLRTPENAFSHKLGNELCFPTGSFEAVLTSRELEYALKYNYVKEVLETAVYEKALLFKDYIDFFYNKRIRYRENNNSSFELIAKLLLNTLYGKWGQRNEVFKVVAENVDMPDGCYNEYDLDNHEWIILRCINGTMEKSIGKVEAFNSFPAIASHITADARMLLYQYIKIAKKKNVFYCDTDSLFVNRKGLNNLKPYLSNSIMGQLKVKSRTKGLEIRGLKDYTFGTKTRIKGVKKDAEKISENKYLQWHWEGLRGSLRNARVNKMILKKVVKVLYRDYFKGELQDNGEVLPFELSEKL